MALHPEGAEISTEKHIKNDLRARGKTSLIIYNITDNKHLYDYYEYYYYDDVLFTMYYYNSYFNTHVLVIMMSYKDVMILL